jgi:hypothetical protein
VPVATDFIEILLQASVFTPGLTFKNGKALLFFLTRWPERFSNVVFASELPPGTPDLVPNVIIQSEDSRLRVQAGPARLDIVWQSLKDGDHVDVKNHLAFCCDVFEQYMDEFLGTIGRVACVRRRVVHESEAAATLSRHFCRDRWTHEGAAIERPCEFALDSAKNYALGDRFQVNSWFKCKSGSLTRPGAPVSVPVILVEQDINTQHDLPASPRPTGRVRDFFALLPLEFDEILELYFPPEAGQ